MSKKQYLDRHGNPIDVYTYPEGAGHQALRDYQHAVEVAHERDGLHVESSWDAVKWFPLSSPSFSWGQYPYRIAAPKIAKGHNPDELTEEQVGVSEGWRLLALKEIAARSQTKDIECWDIVRWNAWGYAGSDQQSTYRTKMPPGYFLPKKKQETEEEAIERVWQHHRGPHGGTVGDALREILKWERERVKNGGSK